MFCGCGMGLGVAIKAFSAALFDREKSRQIERLLAGKAAVSSQPEPAAIEPPRQTAPPSPVRDPSITLLATLQREARLIDLIQEDLSQYSDAQVGAAARPCLQQCSGVLSRLFGMQPLVEAEEGESVQVGESPSALRFQWIGEGAAESGKLIHHGWQATKIELPTWSGNADDANIIAPAQVEGT